MLYVATKGQTERVMTREIAEALRIPHHYLAKILEDLSQSGLLLSSKGVGGGFALGRPATKISLLDIIEVLDGSEFLENCALGFPGCSEEHPCPAHPAWKLVKKQITDSILRKSIAELSPDLHHKVRSLRKPRGTSSIPS